MKLINYKNILSKITLKNSKISTVFRFPLPVSCAPSPVSRLLSPPYRLLIPVFYLLFLITFPVFSQQQVLTYDEAIRIALEQNIQIKQQQNNLKVSQAEKQQSLANFLPGVSANGRGNRTDGRQWSNEESMMVNTTIDRASYSIGADMTVFNGFRNVYRLQQTNNLLEAQKQQVEQSKQDIIYRVSQQFIQILLDKELVLIAEQDVEVQRKLYEQLEVYVKTGARTKTELLSQEAQLKTSEVNLLSWQNQLRQDKASLAKTLFFDSEKEFNLLPANWNIDSILNANYNIDSLYQTAFNSRPELKMLEAEEKANKSDIAISRSAYMPRVSIYYNYGSDYASNNRRFNPNDSLYYKIPFNDQLWKDNYSHQYGFNISIPIFTRLQTRTNVVRSKIDYENAKLEYQDFEMQLKIDIQNAHQDFISKQETYLANRIRANASQLAYEKQQEMYRMGQGSLIDLNIENRRRIEAQSEEAQAKYNLVFQQIVLEYHIGDLR